MRPSSTSIIRPPIRACSPTSASRPSRLRSWEQPRAGRYPQKVLAEKFAHALFPRTTNRYGCVTLHRYHFYVEAGVPQTQVLLWVYGEQLRAVLDNVVLAEYHGHNDGRVCKVTAIRDGVFYPTRFASPQGTLIPLTPQEALIIYRPRASRRPTWKPFSTQQLGLFELVRIG